MSALVPAHEITTSTASSSIFEGGNKLYTLGQYARGSVASSASDLEAMTITVSVNDPNGCVQTATLSNPNNTIRSGLAALYSVTQANALAVGGATADIPRTAWMYTSVDIDVVLVSPAPVGCEGGTDESDPAAPTFDLVYSYAGQTDVSSYNDSKTFIYKIIKPGVCRWYGSGSSVDRAPGNTDGPIDSLNASSMYNRVQQTGEANKSNGFVLPGEWMSYSQVHHKPTDARQTIDVNDYSYILSRWDDFRFLGVRERSDDFRLFKTCAATLIEPTNVAWDHFSSAGDWADAAFTPHSDWYPVSNDFTKMPFSNAPDLNDPEATVEPTDGTNACWVMLVRKDDDGATDFTIAWEQQVCDGVGNCPAPAENDRLYGVAEARMYGNRDATTELCYSTAVTSNPVYQRFASSPEVWTKNFTPASTVTNGTTALLDLFPGNSSMGSVSIDGAYYTVPFDQICNYFDIASMTVQQSPETTTNPSGGASPANVLPGCDYSTLEVSRPDCAACALDPRPDNPDCLLMLEFPKGTACELPQGWAASQGQYYPRGVRLSAPVTGSVYQGQTFNMCLEARRQSNLSEYGADNDKFKVYPSVYTGTQPTLQHCQSYTVSGSAAYSIVGNVPSFVPNPNEYWYQAIVTNSETGLALPGMYATLAIPNATFCGTGNFTNDWSIGRAYIEGPLQDFEVQYSTDTACRTGSAVAWTTLSDGDLEAVTASNDPGMFAEGYLFRTTQTIDALNASAQCVRVHRKTSSEFTIPAGYVLRLGIGATVSPTAALGDNICAQGSGGSDGAVGHNLAQQNTPIVTKIGNAVFVDEDGDGYCAPAGIDLNHDGDCDDPGEVLCGADGVDRNDDGDCSDATDTPGSNTPSDCDDSDALTSPVAMEICGNTADNDCDGFVSASDYNCSNPDDDGVPSELDADDDGDGIPDIVELGGVDLSGDSDNDNIPDYKDPDVVDCPDVSPTDGVCDSLPLSIDADGDGVPNHLDLDSDNDGIPDLWENGGSELDSDMDGVVDNPLGDVDGDGLDALFDADDDDESNTGTLTAVLNTDGTGPADYLDLDSDGDGITDIIEALGVDADGDGRVDNFTDGNGNGYAEALDRNETTPGTPWLVPDTDGDFNASAPGDINSGYDFQDIDSDNDTIPDSIEGHDVGVAGTNMDKPDGLPDYDVNQLGNDSDGDGIDDVFDIDCTLASPCNGVVGTVAPIPNHDSGIDSLPDYRDTDDDGDGISTLQELTDAETYDIPSAENDGDVDGDGILNYLDTDTDGDGVSDATEAQDGGDSNDDNIPDYMQPDVFPADTDGDGLLDTVECGGPISGCPDTDGDGVPDYLDIDDDNDGILTADEWPLGSNGGPGDVDNDGVPNHLDLDTDNDGIPDIWENGDGALDRQNRTDCPTRRKATLTQRMRTTRLLNVFDDDDGDANVGRSQPVLNTDGTGVADFADLDSDDDGVMDIVEAVATGAVMDADFDGRVDDFSDDNGNGYSNVVDPADGGTPWPMVDTDNDGTPDFQDMDSDNDSVPDSIEAHDVDANGVADVPPSHNDADNDGIDDAYDGNVNGDTNLGTVAPLPNRDGTDDVDYRDTDDDNDGILTADEVSDGASYNGPAADGNDVDGDGIPNYLDTDSDGDGLSDQEEGRSDDDGDGIRTTWITGCAVHEQR
ncbi:MAG: hypothetical protein R3A47_08565 [Polyangiales bacterium]